MALLIKPRWGSVPHTTTRKTHNEEDTTMYWGGFGDKKEKKKTLKKKKNNKTGLIPKMKDYLKTENLKIWFKDKQKRKKYSF